MPWAYSVLSESSLQFVYSVGGNVKHHIPATYTRRSQPLPPARPVPNTINGVRIVGAWQMFIDEDAWEELLAFLNRNNMGLSIVESQADCPPSDIGSAPTE